MRALQSPLIDVQPPATGLVLLLALAATAVLLLVAVIFTLATIWLNARIRGRTGWLNARIGSRTGAGALAEHVVVLVIIVETVKVVEAVVIKRIALRLECARWLKCHRVGGGTPGRNSECRETLDERTTVNPVRDVRIDQFVFGHYSLSFLDEHHCWAC